MFLYAMTRTGEAQHAVRYYGDHKRGTKTVCGRRVHTAYGPTFDGSTGIQHPWRCDSCHHSIQRAAA